MRGENRETGRGRGKRERKKKPLTLSMGEKRNEKRGL
jgi:hypothetical protein